MHYCTVGIQWRPAPVCCGDFKGLPRPPNVLFFTGLVVSVRWGAGTSEHPCSGVGVRAYASSGKPRNALLSCLMRPVGVCCCFACWVQSGLWNSCTVPCLAALIMVCLFMNHRSRPACKEGAHKKHLLGMWLGGLTS